MKKDKYNEKKSKELNDWTGRLQKRIPKEIKDIPISDIQKLIHDMNIHQMNLEIQNEELRKTKINLEKMLQERTDELKRANDKLQWEQKRKKLKKSEAEYRVLIENLQEGIWHIDKDAYTTFVNSRMSEMLGYSVDEMIGKHLFEFMDEEGAEICKQLLKKSKQGIKEQHEFEFIRKDGTRVNTLLETAPIFEESKNYNGAVAYVMDITERKKAERELMDTKERLEKTFQSLDSALFILDSNNPPLIADCNSAASKIFGYRKEEMIGKPVDFLHISKQTRSKFQKTLYPTIEQQGYLSNHEFKMKRRDGDIFSTEHSVFQLKDEQDKRTGWISVIRDISERKQVEKALEESKEKYRLVSENIPVTVYSALPDEHFTNLFISGRMKELTGFSGEQFMEDPKLWESIIHPEDRKYVWEKIREHRKKKMPLNVEYRIKTKSNILKWIKDKAMPMLDDNGKIIRIDGFMEDITEQKQAEEALKESEEKFRNLADQSPNMIFINKKGRVVYTNKRCEEIMGYKGEELCSHDFNFLTLIDPEYIELAQSAFNKHMKGAEVESYEYCLITKDGKKLNAIINTKLIDHEGDVAILGIVTDITERKKAEEELRQSEEKYRDLVENINDVIYAVNIDGFVTYVSPAIQSLLGYSPPEIIGRHFDDIVYHEDLPISRERFSRLLSGDSLESEIRLVTKAGELCWVRVSSRPAYIGDRTMGVKGVLANINEYRKTQEWLRESEEHFRSLVTVASDSISMTDLEGNIQFVNEASKFLLGLNDVNEIIGRNILEYIEEESQETARKTMEKVLSKGIAKSAEYSIVRKDGKKIPVEMTASLIRDAKSKPFRLMAITRDITERKLREAELREALSKIEELKEQLYAENIYLREEIKLRHEHEQFVGQSHAIKNVLSQAEQVAETDSTVLILGETGTGKELLAHTIHNLSQRRGHPLVNVNCAALPQTLIESELFGHEKGAFTGALSKHVGRFEIANDGTIFLDEISELSPELQVKLLRVLQEGQFERIGSSKTISVNVRVIAATNQDLSEAVQNGSFRKDLYYRLNVFPIIVPPLRQRRDDIPLLVWTFVKEFEKKMGKRIETISPASMKDMQNYDWPGNVRELRNIIERAMILTKGYKLQVQLPKIADLPPSQTMTLEEIEKKHIIEALSKSNWRISGKNGAAERLGLKPTTLHSKMAKLGIKRKS